ncbi:MAG: cob(I)yrinic acid a,c-diamide adenosyltransferase [Devosiaceae bacterium]|nr:cob(I)yrinic acid a,c-diamide adenosyltransferase [Devosiaceae bacterium]
MVKLNKIYTRTGDKGTTALVRGPRRHKDDIRVCAYGSVDETNAFIGTARVCAHPDKNIDQVLARVQNDLFDLGSDLATPGSDENQQYPALRITQAQIDWLEQKIDLFNDNLRPLTSFVLPAGSALSVALHVARTVARRAERDCVTLLGAEPQTSPLPQIYLNRLSDLLFVLSRVANNNGQADILWTPGAHTQSQKPSGSKS